MGLPCQRALLLPRVKLCERPDPCPRRLSFVGRGVGRTRKAQFPPILSGAPRHCGPRGLAGGGAPLAVPAAPSAPPRRSGRPRAPGRSPGRARAPDTPKHIHTTPGTPASAALGFHAQQRRPHEAARQRAGQGPQLHVAREAASRQPVNCPQSSWRRSSPSPQVAGALLLQGGFPSNPTTQKT